MFHRRWMAWRAAVVLAVLCATPALPALCTRGDAGGAGYMSEDLLRQRGDDFLAYATEVFQPGKPRSVIAHLERASREPGFVVDTASVTPAALSASFADIDAMQDKSDFDMLDVLWLWLEHHDQLPADTVGAIESRILAFKHWYTEPTPPGLTDDRWYWSENHRITFHVIEYLAGQAFPSAIFTNSGRTGMELVAHARPLLAAWLTERKRYGFFEWHSNVYYVKDVVPLLLLIEHADDPELVCDASMILDLLLLDVALHLQNGTFAAPRGRTYMKNKWSALDEGTFGLQKFLFDDTIHPYQSRQDFGALGFTTARRYRLPEVIRRIAVSDEVTVDRERMSVALDPYAPLDAPPMPPSGHSYEAPDEIAFWWSLGGLSYWPVVPLTLATVAQYDLWNTELFQPFAFLEPLAGDPVTVQRLAQQLAHNVAFGLLSQVNTYTWRAPEVSLATAQDYRAGDWGSQFHAWQATLDAQALVFTTGPTDPVTTSPQLEWRDGDGYWTASILPRSAQHENVAIHIYAPKFASAPGGPDGFAYEPMTHAYFPQERFDEVRQQGGWTFGRKGEGFVALWSWRPTQWQAYDPAVLAQRGFTQSFDLVAPGGADDVWIVEVGRAADAGSFDAFVAAIAAAPIDVVPLGSEGGVPLGFDVRYGSPSRGAMAFGTNAPLQVRDRVRRIREYRRLDNPWVKARFGSPRLYVRDRASGARLRLHLDRALRCAVGPR